MVNVGLISPSESIARKAGEKGIRVLSSWGWTPVRGDKLYGRYGFLAGTDAERVKDIHQFVKDSRIEAIFAIAGGSNANRLLPLLDYALIRKNPKQFYGMSDVSTLLNAIHAKTSLITYHGPNVLHLRKGDTFTRNYLQQAFSGDVFRVPWRQMQVLRHGRCNGHLLGGNLEAVSNLLGTPYNPLWKGALFFWEEIKETNAEISRLLMNYKNAGVFDKIKGMIIGKLYKCSIRNGMSIRRIILDLTKEYDFPIVMNAPFGHFCPNVVLPIGGRSVLDTREKRWEIGSKV